MLELYISNRLVDLSEDVSIPLSFKSIDTDTPTTEHGGYSKTVTLKGTKTNNEIFGDSWKLSRTIVSGDDLSGVKFDARLRVDATLLDNGRIVLEGYCQLNDVKLAKNEINYNITLYSNIGDFFYNLIYDEEGNERTLYDLYWGFNNYNDGHKMDLVEENTVPLFPWNKEYIKEGWDKGCDSWDSSTRKDGITPSDIIVAAPTYGGTYDDFDNDKILTKYDDLDSSTKNKIINGGYDWQGFNPYKGWIVTEATRELDEHEVRDMRSKYQRRAIRLKAILETICDPINNGGYEVEWDKDILDASTPIGRIYDKTFVVYDRFDFDNDESVNDIKEMELPKCALSPWWNIFSDFPYATTSGTAEFTESTTSSKVFDTSDYLNPNFSIAIRPIISGNCGTNPSDFLYTSYHREYHYGSSLSHTWDYAYGGIAVKIRCKKNGKVLNESPTHLLSSDIWNSGEAFGYGVENWNVRLAAKLGINASSLVVHTSPIRRKSGIVYQFDDAVEIKMQVPQDRDITFDIVYQYVCVSANEYSIPTVSNYILVPTSDSYGDYMSYADTYCEIAVYKDDRHQYPNGLYDGYVNPIIQEQTITKKILFGNSKSPYDYLIGFTKMLGLKYITDVREKKVHILQRKNYYKDEVINIDGRIDRNKEITVYPTLCEYKWYQYGLENVDSYANKLYKKRNNNEYGTLKINTNYYFNNETNELLDGVIFKNVIPYRQNSIFYNSLKSAPCTMLAPTFGTTMFKKGEEGIEDKSFNFYGYAHSNKLSKVYDAIPKVCGFGDDNSNVDISPTLLFYDGMDDSMEGYILSDNLNAMDELNGNSCFLYCPSGYGYESIDDSSSQRVCYPINSIPRFSKYIKNNI